jgi:hypothetical protein
MNVTPPPESRGGGIEGKLPHVPVFVDGSLFSGVATDGTPVLPLDMILRGPQRAGEDRKM